MADPRLTPSHDGLRDDPTITMIADGVTILFDKTKTGGSLAVGKAVMLSGDDTVALATDGARVYGSLETVESDGRCTVQKRGVLKLPADAGAIPAVGARIVGALSGGNPGFIRAVVAPTTLEPTLAQLLELGAARGTVLNNNAAAGIYVDMDT